MFYIYEKDLDRKMGLISIGNRKEVIK